MIKLINNIIIIKVKVGVIMSRGTVNMTASKMNRRDNLIRRVTIAIITILLLLAFLFITLMFVYKGGRFFISLDPNFSVESGLYMYESEEEKVPKSRLYAKDIDFMDNISINWIPKDIHTQAGGSHNGENYIAHTFHIENSGTRTVDYWYEIEIDDVIKNVDEAIRFMIIHNGERKVYAKINNQTKKEEKDTIAFFNEELAVVEPRYGMKPKDVDRITIVIWLEGDDPDCVDSIIGGEIKANMQIVEGHKAQDDE